MKRPKSFRKGDPRAKAAGRNGGRRSRRNPKPGDGFGLGQATNAPVAAFRAFWREWLMTPEVVAFIKKAALSYAYDEKGHRIGPSSTAVSLLGKLIDKCHPNPQSVKVQDEGARPIRILLGERGQEIELPYLKGPLVIPPDGGPEDVH